MRLRTLRNRLPSGIQKVPTLKSGISPMFLMSGSVVWSGFTDYYSIVRRSGVKNENLSELRLLHS